MIAALDVYYSDSQAQAAAIVFDQWHSERSVARHTAMESSVAEYEPGQFYLRELSPLLKVIEQIERDVDTFIIDGYCHLSSEFAPGLGAHLYESLAQRATIVGVAKNRYRQSQHAVEVFRASSQRPLFVTAIGIPYNVAGKLVESMAGEFRIPEMLKAVDRLSRTATVR